MVGKGIDVEALSPRDANARRPRSTAADLKTKAAAQLKASKDKEHPPPPPPHVTEPPSVDRKDGAVYQVGKMLGKGGFAVCYSGTLAGTKKLYALKIVKSKMPTKMEQKFQTELQIHSKMRQVNIVQFFRAFSFESSTYLVLELCPNGSLMDMVKRRRGVTEPEVRFYAVQIAGAIKYMHAKGIIHRDLKMGNVFLDKNMNAKIGDFGLAALLVTGRDMQTIRRTTLCGTPNYIAPEILEKGKKGHDHMVDIWSLGIIMFAMLTSKPPFQSSTTDEIYRRARERDYEWPTRDGKTISEEAKHVVASMLQEPHMRPDPDAIVEHPFFIMGYMPKPEDMSVKLKELPPDNDAFYQQPSSRRVQAHNLETLQEMCRTCNIGPWNSIKIVSKPVWREMAAEEQAGLTPAIPLADNVVYRPFENWLQENRLQENRLQENRLLQGSAPSASTSRTSAPVLPITSSSATPSLPTSSHPPLSEWSTQTASVVAHAMESVHQRTSAAALPLAPASLLRAPPQSFASQQRAQGRPARGNTPAEPVQSVDAAAPMRSASSAMARSEAATTTLVRRPSARRDIPLTNSLSLQAREQKAAASKPSGTARTRTLLPSGRPAAAAAERAERRTVSRSVSAEIAPAAPVVVKTHTRQDAAPGVEALSLFGPTEVQELVPNSEPDAVMMRLRKLQAELDRALNARTMAFTSATRDRAFATPPQIVVKWVDYTNRFGVGYILNDGSIGCILMSIPAESSSSSSGSSSGASSGASSGSTGAGNEQSQSQYLPPACLLIHNAERHILRREDPSYPDRHQIVPMHTESGMPITEGICFYENNGEQGLHRVRVDPSHFRLAVDPRTGVAAKLSAGKDVYDHRKRARIVLWKKFANYMLAYGRELEAGDKDPARKQQSASGTAAASNPVPSDVVTFYQRFGDVGCWVFCDGHMQFNFPDHTKLVIDAAGVWCHFWHLPAKAAEQLAATGILDEAALDERSVLSYPLQTLLNFGVGSSSALSATGASSSRRRPVIRPELHNIPAANDFRRKVEFIRSVVREWVSNGGIGNSDRSRAGRLRWMGARETLKRVPGMMVADAVPASKHVWVTVGACQGDIRLSCLVDPSRPDEFGPDTVEKR